MGKLKEALSIKGLLGLTKSTFDKIIETNNGRTNTISLTDSLMSGLAVFSLKFKSLLQFEKAKIDDKTLAHNLKMLFQIKDPISDTQVRKRLDVVEPDSIRKPFKVIFSTLQRSNNLLQYRHINNTYLLANDATGFFSSKEINCENCCEKKHKNGTTTYHHNMLCGAIVHPKMREVIPLAPEPIIKQDGVKKNDCELNGIKRFLAHVRREHPHLPITVVEDALYANGPHIKSLQKLKMNFIIMAKEKGNEYLFDAVKHGNCSTYEFTDLDGINHKFNYINNIPLNDSHEDLLVNFVEYWETDKSGKMQYFSWVTDHLITKDNVYDIMKGGRARWRIENETFNTLKNQGYNFEHNYGHGYKNLSTVFAMLMMLAFLIDQVQSLCCSNFNAALKKAHKKTYLWEKMRNIVQIFLVDSWELLFHYIANKQPIPLPQPP